jgi:acetoin utilization protein AcuB
MLGDSRHSMSELTADERGRCSTRKRCADSTSVAGTLDALPSTMKIKEIMRGSPWVVEGVDSLGTAHALMRLHAIRHLPVLRDDMLVGMLSERDILEYRANLEGADDWTRVAVSGAMDRSPQTAGPDDSVTEVTGRLATSKLDALPVVELGRLVGIVTVTDILAAEVQRAMAPAPCSPATVADAMTLGPFTIGPDDSLLEAATRMSLRGIRHLPVIDKGAVVGVLSERDLRTHVGDPSLFTITRGKSPLRVRDVLTQAPITVAPEQSLVEIAKRFTDHRIGAMPVVDRDGILVGIISYVDVLRTVAHAA